MNERELQCQCERILRQLKAAGAILDWYHRPDRRAGRREQPGLPDLIIAVRPEVVLAVELKVGRRKLTVPQERWLDCFGTHGCEARSVYDMLTLLRWWGVLV